MAWGGDLSQMRLGLFAMVVLMLLSCYLLVSEIPMFALKFKTWGWHGNEVKWGFLLSCIPLLFIFGIGALAIIIAWYIVLSVITGKSSSSHQA